MCSHTKYIYIFIWHADTFRVNKMLLKEKTKGGNWMLRAFKNSLLLYITGLFLLIIDPIPPLLYKAHLFAKVLNPVFVWHRIAGPCSLSCHGDTNRQWCRTDFCISLHNPTPNCAACWGLARANCMCGWIDGCMCMFLWLRASGREKKTEIKTRWEDWENERKRGEKRMTRTGMNDGDNEWETQTDTHWSQTTVHTHPPGEMTGVRTCEWAGRVCGRRDAATVQLILPSVWSLQPALRGFSLHYFEQVHTARCQIRIHSFLSHIRVL